MACEQIRLHAAHVDTLHRSAIGGGGEGVFVRPVVTSDATRMADFVRTLTPEARYQRFHIGLHELPPAMVDRFVRMGSDELALVAWVCEAGRELVVAEGRHAAIEDDPMTHEFAIVVHQDFRRTGLGEHLLRRLERHAAEIGVRTLVGDLLHGNHAMLSLALKLGFAARRHPQDARLQRVEKVLVRPAPGTVSWRSGAAAAYGPALAA
jgi:acetyltransferase